MTEKNQVELNNFLENHKFLASYHLGLLKDITRLDFFRKAISLEASNKKVILDIGCGTGILSYYAAKCGFKKIISVEVNPHTADLAKINLASQSGVVVLNTHSFNLSLDITVDVVVTETISNSCGLFEDIVEICYQIKQTHPSIQSFIPSTVNVFAQPFYAPKVDIIFDDFSKLFGFDCKSNLEKLEHLFCTGELVSGCKYFAEMPSNICEVHEFGDPILLKSYTLGVDSTSDFINRIEVDKRYNAVNIYFEVYSHDLKLSNAIHSSKTSWFSSYYKRPSFLTKADVSYSSKSKLLQVDWQL